MSAEIVQIASDVDQQLKEWSLQSQESDTASHKQRQAQTSAKTGNAILAVLVGVRLPHCVAVLACVSLGNSPQRAESAAFFGTCCKLGSGGAAAAVVVVVVVVGSQRSLLNRTSRYVCGLCLFVCFIL